MQTLELMRRRIESAEDLHSVVRVMKALAAVSIRQYEKAVASLSEYNRTIEMGLQIVLRNQPEEFAAAEPQLSGRWGAVVFGSDQGMCGSFNDQVASFALEQMQFLPGKPAEGAVLAVGARVAGRLEDAGFADASCYPVPASVAGITPIVHELLLKVEELRVEQDIDRLFLFHHRPLVGAGSRPQRLLLLPVDPGWLRELGAKRWPSRLFADVYHGLASAFLGSDSPAIVRRSLPSVRRISGK